MKKIISIFMIAVMLFTGCASTDTETRDDGTKLIGSWTVYGLKRNEKKKDISMAKLIKEGKYKTSDIYTFKKDGNIVSDTDIFGLSQWSWKYKDKKYSLNNSKSKNIVNYKENKLTIKIGKTTLYLIKGKKDANKLIKEAGLEHVEELQIIDSKIVSLGDGFYNVVYKKKNNSSKKLTFEGISIEEYDTDGTELDSYYSYNKNATTFELDPGKAGKIDLTFAKEDKINKIISKGYAYSTKNNEYTEGKFFKPYSVKIK